jgi:hypothetical protein
MDNARNLFMKHENLSPIIRMIVREVALGLSDDDITVNHPQYNAAQISKIRAGATFKSALKAMQVEIDEQVISSAAADPVRKYLASKGLSAAKTLARLASNDDEETPHAVQAKAADSILSKGGYASTAEQAAIPVLMLSPDKLASVLSPKTMALETVPDSVDGHAGDLKLVE